ncbi:50S ribosomal protein L21 [Sodalis-like secondary symbiont of Drepanosiphum platanoidis]|uniref:50S ribosomal protein L21 n=1 Tax=Sodalis-like secondary symbiont of Drepanosiphum platanoidis TaxID=2994493 RepID=UPI0034639210
MYAIFESGGKQHKVNKGQIIRLEKINLKIGKIIESKKILMLVNNKKIYFGNPFCLNKKILMEIIKHDRYKKIIIYKFKRRKHFKKKQGHRQWFTDVKILDII